MEINFSALSSKQVENLNLAIKSYDERNVISSNCPSVLYIELTQNCIARCEFCREKQWVNSANYNMNQEVFQILLREYVPYSILVDLRSRGESLILPDFADFVHKISHYHPKIRLTTTLGCGTQEALQSLIDYDVFVSVSFDAADKKTYQMIRPGICYDTVIKNLEFVTKEMLKKYGTLEGKIRLGICPLQRKNLSYLQGVMELANFYKIPEIRIGPLGAPLKSSEILENNQFFTLKALKKCISFAKKNALKIQLARPFFDAFYIKEKAFDLCCHPWLYAQINYAGDVLFCDHPVGAKVFDFIIGNVKEEKNIWNGEKAQYLRSFHIRNLHERLPKPCVKCYIKGRYADHEHEIYQPFRKWLVTEIELEKIIYKVWQKRWLCLKKDIFFRLHRKFPFSLFNKIKVVK